LTYKPLLARLAALVGTLLPLLFFSLVMGTSTREGSSVTAQERGGGSPPVVLLSVDGLKPEWVLDADRLGWRLPHLRQLLREGLHATAMTGVVPTVTYPSHTTMVTGVNPDRHRIDANTPFDPFSRNQGGWYWYAEDIRVETLWEVCRRAGISTASVDWPVTVGAPIDFNLVQFWRASTPDDRKLIRALSTPGLLTEAERVLGPYPEGYDYEPDADLRRAAFQAWILETKRPRFLTGYLAGLDTIAHRHGPGSPEVQRALETIDQAVGKIRAAALRSGDGQAYLCLVSDHGFLETHGEVRLNAALREAGLLVLDRLGKLHSWQAIAWNSGGMAAIRLQDPSDRLVRQRVRQVLARLLNSPSSPLLAWYEGEDARRLRGFPEAAFLVATRPGYGLSSSFDLPLWKKLPAVGGGHGFHPDLPEMDASFFLAGPGIPAGRSLGRVEMRDVAPTLAALLGVALPQAEGRNLLSLPASPTPQR
jgi:predicted AlkP superfamily pyrophosphatase or phosphodiesterase